MYGEKFELQPGCFERQRKVSQSVRWGYATTPKIPRRTFLHNGFDDILCGIHPRELLQIEIWSILMTVSLDLDTSSIRTSTQVGTKYRTAVQLQL